MSDIIHKLEKYEERLQSYFLNKRDKNPELEIYLLDHDLSDSELIELEACLQEYFSETHLFRYQYMLCYLVIITQVAFDFDGIRFWDKLIEKFPVPEYNNYWEGYSRGKARSIIYSFYEEFQDSYGGVVPLGYWAATKTYICHPVTHAILPKNLQLKLFKFIKERLDYIENEHFETPETLGREISNSYLAYNTQFDTLFDHPILLGSLVFDISEQEPNTDEGKKQLIVFSSNTLSKIKENLDDVTERDIKIRSSQAKKRRAISLNSPNKIKKVQRKNRKAGIYFSIDLERGNDQEAWSLKLNLPRIRVKSQTDTDFINKSKLYISTSNNNDEQKVVTRGALEFSSRSFKIEELIDDDDPLISLHIESESASDRAFENIDRIEERFTPSSFLGNDPWLFAIDGKETTAKRVHSIVPGQKYLLLQRQNSEDYSIGNWISQSSIDSSNLEIYEINLPTDYQSSEKAILDELGIKISSDLIKIQPFGLSISPKNSEIIQWARGKECLFKLEVTERLNRLKLSFLEEEEDSAIIDHGINEQGEYFLMLKSDSFMPDGITCEIELTTESGERYEERLDFDFFEIESWAPGQSHEVAFTANFIDLETKRPTHFSFEEFLGNDYEVNITFPVKDCGEVSLILMDHNEEEILNYGPIKIEELKLSQEAWDHHFIRTMQSLDDSKLGKVSSARIKIDASEYGSKTFTFNSHKTLDLQFKYGPNKELELVDRRESDNERTTLLFYDISKPWIHQKYQSDENTNEILNESNQKPGLYQVNSDPNSFDSFIFSSSENKKISPVFDHQGINITKLLRRYGQWYRARAIDRKSREMRRLALLNISSMMMYEIMNNDAGDWPEYERRYFYDYDKEALIQGLSETLRKIPAYVQYNNGDIEGIVEKVVALAETKEKKQIVLQRNDGLPIANEDHDEITSSLISLNISSDDLSLENGKLYLYRDENDFQPDDLLKIEELANLESEEKLDLKKISFDDRWRTEHLIETLRHDPIKYFIRSKYPQEEAIETIVNLSTRPGIYVDDIPTNAKIVRAQIESSKLPEMIPIIRFLTLYSVEIISERYKPLFRAWEWEVIDEH